MHRTLTLILLVPLLASSSAAQNTTGRTDTLSSVPRDTSRSAGVDTLVVYSARDSIVYSMKTRFMNLYGEGKTSYQQMSLQAERIDVNWDTATLTAVGVQDTARADSVIGPPVIQDAGEEYRGEVVSYNFRTRKGRITVASTEIDEGYYIGQQIKKIDTDVLYVADGRYTTCNLDHPHFFFTSPRMKLYVQDKVVAEPVYFYVADVPVFALPFGVFPSRGGRASGIIAPAFGEDGRLGQYISHLGYYWALSDYTDLSTAFDLSTQGGWANRSTFNYALRYNFRGFVRGEYRKVLSGEPQDPDYRSTDAYDVTLVHNQEIDPSARLDVNFRFTSGNFRDYSRSIEDILQQNIFSAASFVKRWDESNRSLSLSVTRDQSLTNGDVREVLPSINFTQSQIFPFRPRTTSRGLSGASDLDRPWLHKLGLNYNASFSNQRSKLQTSIGGIKTGDTLGTVQDFRRGTTQSLGQNLGFSISPRVGNITVTPSLSFSDNRTWTDDRVPGINTADSSLMFTDIRRRTIQGTLRTGISASTRFYGIAQPRVFGIEAFRHTVNPTLSLSYGKQVYWENTSPIPRYQLLANMNVANNFEMKVATSDTTEPAKIQLMNLGFGTSYDFARDSLNFNPVGITARTDIGSLFNISGSATYNLYQYDNAARTRVNRYLLSEAGKFGDLTNVSMSLSTSFRGEKKTPRGTQGIPTGVQQQQLDAESGAFAPTPRPVYQTIYDREEADFSIPWNLTLSYTFSQSQTTPISPVSRTSSANASLSFNLTEAWQIGTTASYDFVNKEHFIPSVDITRDLHCWTMRFTWYPMGIREGYRLELRVKAPQLQDVKVTKQSSARGVFY